jgi:hypothetical protein
LYGADKAVGLILMNFQSSIATPTLANCQDGTYESAFASSKSFSMIDDHLLVTLHSHPTAKAAKALGITQLQSHIKIKIGI